ncbi:hypothetical protein BZA05DRAFT_436554 [Tricharina praecox]|uniref:uncharacterized protein n=1 Tax=Tricharina praecox TaxID=43433 RepID=UPI00221EAA9B|nr:uncharacterized protein BZA05DRAFT_436554 [Tricharina praecox]KAI5850995.1 hypothetical protein BZA05DRAFT_436554 [Tricharina praecox]
MEGFHQPAGTNRLHRQCDTISTIALLCRTRTKSRISSSTPERLTKIFGRPNVASAAESTVRSYIVATRLGGTRYHRNPAQQLNGTAPLATYGSTKRYGAKALARRGLLIKRPARRTLWATTNFEARQTSHCVPRFQSYQRQAAQTACSVKSSPVRSSPSPKTDCKDGLHRSVQSVRRMPKNGRDWTGLDYPRHWSGSGYHLEEQLLAELDTFVFIFYLNLLRYLEEVEECVLCLEKGGCSPECRKGAKARTFPRWQRIE